LDDFYFRKKSGYGTGDLYVSYRKDVSNPLGWEKVENAGSVINSAGYDACALFHAENNIKKVYFVSNRSGGTGKMDLYVSSYNDGKFATPVLLKGINSSAEDMHFAPADGFIWTDRKGGYGKHDIWITTKRKGEYEWETPINLGGNINTSSDEGMPSITSDKSLFVFHSDRPGGNGKYDVYFAKPVK
jgi:hypothetical protein